MSVFLKTQNHHSNKLLSCSIYKGHLNSYTVLPLAHLVINRSPCTIPGYPGAQSTNSAASPTPSTVSQGSIVSACLGEAAGRLAHYRPCPCSGRSWGLSFNLSCPRAGFINAPEPGGMCAAEETCLLLSNFSHNHGRGLENRLASRLPLPLDSPSRMGGGAKAQEPPLPPPPPSCITGEGKRPPLPTPLRSPQHLHLETKEQAKSREMASASRVQAS